MRHLTKVSPARFLAAPALIAATVLSGCAAEQGSSSISDAPSSSQPSSSASGSAEFEVEVLVYSGRENPAFSSTGGMRSAAAACLHRLGDEGAPAAEFPGDGGLGYVGAVFEPAPTQNGLGLVGMRHDTAFGKKGDTWSSVECKDLGDLLAAELDKVEPGLTDELSSPSSG